MIRKLTFALAALVLAAIPTLAQSPTGSWQVDAYPVDAAGHPAATTVKVPFSGVPIAPAQIPAPTASTLGGVKSSAAPANNFQTGIDTTGAPTYAQPSYGNVSGTAPMSALGNVGVVHCGAIIGANFNSTADQPMTISVPTTLYVPFRVIVTNASTSLTTAQGGMYSAASKGGVAFVVAGQAWSAATNGTPNTAGNTVNISVASSVALNVSTVYFSLTTAQGAPATADVDLYCMPIR